MQQSEFTRTRNQEVPKGDRHSIAFQVCVLLLDTVRRCNDMQSRLDGYR